MNETLNENKICLGQEQKNTQLYDYSKFLTDGFELDEELMMKFQPVAQKLNLTQESVEMLLEIALEMSKKQRALYLKDKENEQIKKVAQYDKMFRDDVELPDLNGLEIVKYMKVANKAYMEFCSPKLKELFEETGLNFHPEFIKMFHKLGELIEEDGLNYEGKPKYEEMTPAQILYGKQTK
ncbi:hypothetical protein IJ670_04940 [bacterium]|nr:hypothetical protein [bacterium]